MLKIFKNNIRKTNDCIILVLPLIIFCTVLCCYFSYVKMYAVGLFQILLSIVTLLIMFCAFSSAWFYMVKKAIILSDKVYVFEKDRTDGLLDLVKLIPKGFGKLFLPMISVTLVYTIMFSVIIALSSYMCTKFVSPIDFDFIFGDELFISSSGLLDKLYELPDKMLWSLNLFFLIINIFGSIVLFLTMFWIPEMVYFSKNPFKGLYYSIKNLFSTFWKSLLLFILICIMYLILTVINSILMIYPVLFFIVLIFSYYFFIYVVVLLFSYYEQQFGK